MQQSSRKEDAEAVFLSQAICTTATARCLGVSEQIQRERLDWGWIWPSKCIPTSSLEVANIESKLRLSTLNTAKTAYASFVLDSGKFFSKYSFSARGGQQSSSGQRYVDKFACQMYLKVDTDEFLVGSISSKR